MLSNRGGVDSIQIMWVSQLESPFSVIASETKQSLCEREFAALGSQ
jgi:hypothetical protein